MQDVKKLFLEAKDSLREASPVDRFFRVLWLLGPLVLLVERTPGDIWLSFLAFSFVIRSVINRDFEFLKSFWVRATLFFCGACLVSAVFSTVPQYALGEAIAWVRFPLFAVASVFWLGSDRRLINMMVVMVSAAFLIMCCILSVEILVEGLKPRLSWPYGDLVSGNFLAKAGMPAIITASALAVSCSGKTRFYAVSFVAVGVVFVVLTGERINSLIMIFGVFIAAFVSSSSRSRFLRLSSFIVLLAGMVLVLHSNAYDRFVTHFIAQIPFNDNSPYFNTMATGIVAFIASPIFGVGTASLRVLCPELVTMNPTLECSNHPHNYYIQLLGETGILGLVSGLAFIGAIIWRCREQRADSRNSPLTKVAWVIPFCLFWPIASTADFFGQWNNLFVWSSVAIALCMSSGTVNRG